MLLASVCMGDPSGGEDAVVAEVATLTEVGIVSRRQGPSEAVGIGEGKPAEENWNYALIAHPEFSRDNGRVEVLSYTRPSGFLTPGDTVGRGAPQRSPAGNTIGGACNYRVV